MTCLYQVSYLRCLLSEYDGFGNFMCRFDQIQHFFHLVSCCVLVASLRACVLACLADLPPASARGQATLWL